MNRSLKFCLNVNYFGRSQKEYSYLSKALSKQPHFHIQFKGFDDLNLFHQKITSNQSEINFVSYEFASLSETINILRNESVVIPLILISTPRNEAKCHELLSLPYFAYTILGVSSHYYIDFLLQETLKQHDYIELKKMLDRSRNTELSLRKVLEESRDGVLIVNEQNEILFLNTAGKEWMGSPPLQAVGEKFGDKLRQNTQFQIQLANAQHDEAYFEFYTSEIHWDNQNAFLAIIRDVTARVDLENRKSEFVSMVSHELRTPLAAIRESISQVSEGLHGCITDPQSRILGLGIQSIDRLTRLINDLLDISKIEANKFKLNIQYNDFSVLLQEIAAEFSSIATAKRISLDLQGTESEQSGFFDRDAITQVISNLLGNAIKFTETGGVQIVLTADEAQTNISIQDSGPGMEKSDVEKLFKPYEQCGKTNRKIKGTGLGLSIAKSLVELHGGTIEVQSEPGKGSTFTIKLDRISASTLLEKHINTIEERSEDIQTLFIPFQDCTSNRKPRASELAELQRRIDQILGRFANGSFRDSKGVYAFLKTLPLSKLEELISKLENELAMRGKCELVLNQKI